MRGLGHSEDRVVWVSESKPASDFDILSVDEDGGELFIEVKATSGRDGRFQWSRSEFERALQERGRYILYRVYQAEARSPVVRSFRDPIGARPVAPPWLGGLRPKGQTSWPGWVAVIFIGV